MNTEELTYMLALQHIPSLSDALAKKLVHRFGSAKAVLKAKKFTLKGVPWLPQTHLDALLQPKQYLKAAQLEIEVMDLHGIQAIAFNQAEYPYRLAACVDGPLVLFCQGNLDFNNPRCISVVGTRKMTTYGQWACKKLIRELAPYNPIIVSGLAFGVDITAHQAALDNGLQTIACMAHGLHTTRPKTHAHFKKLVTKHGGFISDFNTTVPFFNKHYLQRNRIIAGLSQATVVVESAAKGGSLVTADIAFSYDRDVFAIPGRTQDAQSAGCNALISSNKAQLLRDTGQLIQILGWEEKASKKQNVLRQQRLFEPLNDLETHVLEYLPEGEKIHLDVLSKNSGISTAVLAGTLLNLELKGLARPLPGKQFIRN